LYSNEDLAVALLEKGADFNILSDDNIPLFIHAAYLGLTGVVKSMILKGADIFATAEDGMTALLVAASEGHVDVVKTLINSDPSTLLAKDVDGTNALMAACLSGHLNVVELLVKSGINLNEQNNDGHTALMFAYNSKNQVESLIEKYSNYFNKGEDASAAVVEEARKVHAQVVQFLIQSGADINIQVHILDNLISVLYYLSFS
jgi:ankyrin repeat protein